MNDNLWIMVGLCIQLCNGQLPTLPKQCEITSIHKFPYTAHVTKNGALHCMGIIMSKQVIVTTAQCTLRENKDDAKVYKVYVGSSRVRLRDAYDVCDLRPHPHFHRGGKHSSFYDIGLIILSTYIRFGKLVSVAKFLPDTKQKTENITTSIASFGFTKSKNNPDRLCVTNMQYTDQDRCNRTLMGVKSMSLPVQMGCMLPTGDCYADPGAGVKWNDYVIGMVVTDMQCESKTMPSIFLDVTVFKNWIVSNINELKPNNCTSIKKNKKKIFEEREYKYIDETPQHDDLTINILSR